jgi:hypothetical protein
MNRISFKHVLVFSIVLFTVIKANGQTAMPSELSGSTIQEQINYLEKHTRIYEGFRAIREDMYQKITRNFLDTLTAEKGRVAALENLKAGLNTKTDSLNALLATTRAQLEETTTSKNSIRVLGLEIRKGVYNTLMWSIVGALVFILILGFLIFKRNLVVLLRTEKDLKELKDEFAAYKQSSRLAREKLEMDNFRAIQKLKGQ